MTDLRALIAVLWPSFLVAGGFTGILFAFVDPWTLMDSLQLDAESRLVGYSLVFLACWIAGIITAFFAILILRTPEPNPGRRDPPEPAP